MGRSVIFGNLQIQNRRCGGEHLTTLKMGIRRLTARWLGN